MTALFHSGCGLAVPSGHDTTASLVAWTLWYLMKHPKVEAKLVAEVLGVMGPDTQPSYQQLSDMRYLNAVLKVGAAACVERAEPTINAQHVSEQHRHRPSHLAVSLLSRVRGVGVVAGGGKGQLLSCLCDTRC